MTEEPPQPHKNKTSNKKVKGRGKGTTKQKVLERRERILEYISRHGEWSFDRYEWAKKEKISKRQIDDDLAWIKEHRYVDAIDAESVKFVLHDDLKEMVVLSKKKLFDPDLSERDRKDWFDKHLLAIDKFTKFLEDYGLKESRETPDLAKVLEEVLQ